MPFVREQNPSVAHSQIQPNNGLNRPRTGKNCWEILIFHLKTQTSCDLSFRRDYIVSKIIQISLVCCRCRRRRRWSFIYFHVFFFSFFSFFFFFIWFFFSHFCCLSSAEFQNKTTECVAWYLSFGRRVNTLLWIFQWDIRVPLNHFNSSHWLTVSLCFMVGAYFRVFLLLFLIFPILFCLGNSRSGCITIHHHQICIIN